MKFLILLSSVLSIQAVLAIPLSSLLNVNQTTPFLLFDRSTPQKLATDVDNINVISKTNDIKFNHKLSELFQHKAVVLFANELQLSIILANEYRGSLVHTLINSVYNRTFQQQKCVYSVIQAQINTCFNTQANHQAERQKTPLLSS